MVSDGWTTIRLGDVCSKIGSGATPRGGSEVYLENGLYTLIRSQNIYNDGFHREGLAYIDEKHAVELNNVEVQKDDVLLNITGDSVARCCQVDQSVLPARVNQHVAIIRTDPKKLDARFLRYFLVSPEMQSRMLSWAGAGGTRNALTKAMIEAFEVFAPINVQEQRAIATILGTLDDKIELLQQMSKTLEELIQAIFKSWFVDFDPIHAKIEGRDSNLPTHLLDLFPDSFEETRSGWIPKGWNTGTFGDVAWHPRRGIQPNEIEFQTPYIALEHMPRRSIALYDWGYADDVESNKFKFNRGEILFGKLRPYFHKVGIAPLDGVCSTDIVVVAPKEQLWFGFVLSHISSVGFVEYTNAGSTGTKMPRTSWAEMARYPIVLPDAQIAEAFMDRIHPTIDRILESIHEARVLAALRDSLLPKLISRQISIQDFQSFVGSTQE